MNGSILHRALAGCVGAAVVLMTVRTTLAQDALGAARDLYRAAMYEDALVRLNTLRGSAHVPADDQFIEQYRAFCLLALGRTTEAERAIEAVVKVAPSFVPSESEESPRIRAAFREVRRRVLPAIIQQQYAQAKAAFDRRDSRSAKAGFQQVLDLLADPDIVAAANESPLSELRTLAAGFRDLSGKSAPGSSASPLPAAPLPRIASDAAPQPLAGRIYGAENPNVVPPVVIRQSCAALADVFAVRTGVIAVVIDETGAVESASMVVTVNPVYDRLAISTAKGWRYKPATLDGVPVKFRKVVLVDPKVTR